MTQHASPVATSHDASLPAGLGTPTVHANDLGAPVQRISSVIDLWVGEQLRQRRKAQGHSLQQVAASCEISVSLLSQIERGLRSVSPRTLEALSVALQLPLETLSRNIQPSEGEADGSVVRAGRHRRLDQEDRRICKENLTPPAASGGIEMYRALIQPGGSTGEALFMTHKGEQIGYVMEGQLELLIEDRLHKLLAGDSFCYDGGSPRRWRNPGPTSTTVLWAIPKVQR
ncbi:helix-turn-helix domain-containing protein [Pigmentiphaga aceris]|uniref:Helix-turn-helix domain-containing protein n=1 Tax=Pigmentiphaga aceris TaxID=1940612 RepID=A0A5C0AR57_9BURK|nr:helix-turn-helix domain-containing protein [Pigmentiphaga aceris]QEI04558.1 helix-turn-helix domain-containing protein [Pigmentiphaga aceris]